MPSVNHRAYGPKIELSFGVFKVSGVCSGYLNGSSLIRGRQTRLKEWHGMNIGRFFVGLGFSVPFVLLYRSSEIIFPKPFRPALLSSCAFHFSVLGVSSVLLAFSDVNSRRPPWFPLYA